MDEPVELSIDPEYLRSLIFRLRAILAREARDMDDSGSNASDDEVPATLQEVAGDLQEEEILEEIDAMDDDHKIELVALMWVGRGDFDAEEWEEALQMAEERHKGPTSAYILSHPLVPDYWAEALDALGHGSEVVEHGEF
jgi:Protein of unknown function (DUF3775)